MYKFFHYSDSTGEPRILIASTTFEFHFDTKCVGFISFEEDFVYAIDRNLFKEWHKDDSKVLDLAQRISAHGVPCDVVQGAIDWAFNALVNEGEVEKRRLHFQKIYEIADKYYRELYKEKS